MTTRVTDAPPGTDGIAMSRDETLIRNRLEVGIELVDDGVDGLAMSRDENFVRIWFEVGIELVDHWSAPRDFQVRDDIIGSDLQVPHDGSALRGTAFRWRCVDATGAYAAPALSAP